MTEIRTIRVLPDTTVEVAHTKQDLATFQEFVGGYVEAYPVQWDDEGWATAYLWCNEHGKIAEPPLPENPVATIAWWTLDPRMSGVDRLHGPVMFTGGADENGDTLSVPEALINVVSAARDMVISGARENP